MNVSVDVERLKVIEEIVNDKQINFGYAPLSDAVARKQAAVWSRHLEDIPTDRLVDVYKAAMRERNPGHTFSTTEMSQAWRRLREREAENARRHPRCESCGNTGKIEYDKPGVGRVSVDCWCRA